MPTARTPSLSLGSPSPLSNRYSLFPMYFTISTVRLKNSLSLSYQPNTLTVLPTYTPFSSASARADLDTLPPAPSLGR
jgi:hypothetical protein